MRLQLHLRLHLHLLVFVRRPARPLNSAPAHFFFQLFGNAPAAAVLLVLQVPLDPFIQSRVRGHPVPPMPFLINFHGFSFWKVTCPCPGSWRGL
jgi:hypothetical protein